MRKEELIEELRRLSPEERREILTVFSAETEKTKPPRVFLSYSRTDISFVHDLMAALERGGVRVWFDVRELMIGENYLVATEQGLRDCDCCVVVVSRYSMASVEVLREVSIARTVGTALLPVMLQDAEVAEPLQNLQWIDFRFHFEAAAAGLIAQLHGRSDAPLIEQRLHSATKPLNRSRGFVPLLHRNAPAGVIWFAGLLFLSAVLLVFAIMPFFAGEIWAGGGLIIVLAVVMAVTAFRIVDRRETRSHVRQSLWSLLFMIPTFSAVFWLVLPSKLRSLVVWTELPSVILIVAALVVSERSASFRRWLPARLELKDFLPARLRSGKRTPPEPAAS